MFLFLVSILAVNSCQSDQEPTSETTAASLPDSIYIAYGQQIAGTTFQHLSGRLQAAMQSGGVEEAVAVCQLAASPLVDSLSQAFKADIRRTALRVRNPNNTPNEQEKAQLVQYEQTKTNGQPMRPQVVDLGNGQMAFYGPILAAELCLKCHGTVGETITQQDHALIKNRYPADQATGYQAGDLRGIWSITFAKNNNGQN